MIRSLLYFAVTAILSAAYLLAGSVLLTDAVDPAAHKALVASFKTWGAITGQPDNLRLLIGTLQVGAAVLLWVPIFSTLANYILIAIMAFAIAAHVQAGEPYTNAAVLLGLLVVRRFLAAPGQSHNKAKSKKQK
jgi:uncharacterized membrane protein YphA (DoxX/SURF4 family)